MYKNEELQQHLTSTNTIKTDSLITAEWNMNSLDNIFKIGNYRYRPLSSGKYKTLLNSFDEYDEGSFYTGATDASVSVSLGLDDDGDLPVYATKQKKKCFIRWKTVYIDLGQGLELIS